MIFSQILKRNSTLFPLFLAFLVSLLSPFHLAAQIETNYVPVELSGEIPQDFLNSCNKNTSILFKISDKKEKQQQRNFNTIMSFSLRELFVSGNIYFNDESTIYVREVVDYILNFANLDIEVNAFVSRFDQPSATAWQDGTIIVNSGLLEQLENEAQLAFVLAHEIGHLVKQHQYKQYIHQQSLKSIQKRALDNERSQLQYSQQNEFEADGYAFNLLSNSKYDLKETLKVFEILENVIKTTDSNIGLALSSDKFPISEKTLCGKGDYGTFMSPARFLGTPENEERIIQRKKLFQQQLSNNNYSGTQQFVVSQERFEQIKMISRFELVENNFHESHYLKSLKRALVLLKEYPENRFLNVKAAENLFYIGYYNKKQQLERLFFDSGQLTDPALASLYCLSNKFAETNLGSMVLGYVSQQYAKFEEDEHMIITMAKTTELFDGKLASIQYYEKYNSLFPNGKHAVFASKKISRKSAF